MRIDYEYPQMKYREQKGLVSIIVPIYNNEVSLRECLDSILAQTFKNWEAILVNDGSMDNTGKIIDEYVQKDCRFIAIHKQNQGTLLARKTGLENSKGEFIANIDHDDTYNLQFLEKMFAKITETNADFVWCNHSGRIFCKIMHYNWNLDVSKNVLTIMNASQGVAYYTWNKLIKRDVYAKVLFPNINLILGEDLVQTIQVAYHSKSAEFIPENLYFYRNGGVSAKENIFSTIQVAISINKILEILFNEVIPYNVKKAFYCKYNYIAPFFFSLSKKERIIFEKEFKKILPGFIEHQQKLRIKFFLILANKGIEFPFKFYEWVKSFKLVKFIKKIIKRILILKEESIQNSYELSELNTAKSIVLFLTPPEKIVYGGVMMIFAFAKYSRIVNKDAVIAISTYPGKDTYAKTTSFPNEEKVYRFGQISENCKFAENLILNIPECIACNFYGMLNDKEIRFLKNVKKLQINIMNQNILLMPSPEKLESLKMLTENITQTTGFERYTTQEVCDNWGYPLYFLLPNNGIDYNAFKTPFSQKENIFYYSPDSHPRKNEILDHLKKLLPDFKYVEIKNLSYTDFLKFASSSKFAITFGEGYDGYIGDIHKVGGIGFAVYNQDFFPSKDFLNFENIFSSWDDLKDNIGKVICLLLNDLQEYNKCSSIFFDEMNKSYKEEVTLNCLKKFYINEPTFTPKNA